MKKRFKKMEDFLKIEKIEKLDEAHKLFIYEKMFKDENKKKYDINEWQKFYYYDYEKESYIPLMYKHNYFSYFLGQNNIFKYVYKCILNIFKKDNSCIYNNGIHLISGYPGAGKTLYSNYIILNIDKNKYFFYTTKEQYASENVYYLPMEKIFNEKKQQFSIPTIDKKGRKLYAIIIDEINLTFNRRENRTAEYSNQFIGLIEFMVSHRHQGVPRLYFIGQKLELQDTQIQSLIMYHHFIKKRKNKYSYQLFKESGKINSVPKKLIIENYCKNEANEFYLLNKSKIKINRLVLGTYNTKYLGETYKKLPSFVDNNE